MRHKTLAALTGISGGVSGLLFPLLTGFLVDDAAAIGIAEVELFAQNGRHNGGVWQCTKTAESILCKRNGIARPPTACAVKRGTGCYEGRDGITVANVWAGYTHLHASGAPQWAPAILQAAARLAGNSDY